VVEVLLALLLGQQKGVEHAREPDQPGRFAHRDERARQIGLGGSARVVADGQAKTTSVDRTQLGRRRE
jgi:hypothetical protein